MIKKKKKEKDKKIILLITLCILLIIILTIIVIIFNKKEEFVPKGWMTGIEQVDYMNIHDFSKNICKHEYYSPTFKIKDNILYDYNNQLIREGMFSIIVLNYGECGDELLFATGLNGKLYFINNQKNNKYRKYQIIDVPSVLYTTEIGFDDENNVITTDYNGTEDNITEFINSLFYTE